MPNEQTLAVCRPLTTIHVSPFPPDSSYDHPPLRSFSLVLLIVSGVLMFTHWRSWRAIQQEELSQMERDYRRRQFRRRMQASGMIGIVGVALFVGAAFFLGRESLVPWIEDIVLIVTYWFAVVLITVWMVLLALVDIWATRRYVMQICEDDLLQQTRIHADLLRQQREKQRLQKHGGNEQTTGDSRENR